MTKIERLRSITAKTKTFDYLAKERALYSEDLY